jgi:hypothetical protein
MEQILAYIKNPKNWKNIAICLLIIIIFLLVKCSSDTNSEKKIMKQNIASLSDSLRISKTKNGEIEFARKLLIADADRLKLLNDSLHKELLKEHGDVKYITKEIIVIKHDTIYLPTTVFVHPAGSEYEYSLLWNHNESGDGWYRNISGHSDFSWDSTNKTPDKARTVITSDELKMTVVTGFKFINGYYETFARTTYKNATIDFQSAIVDETMINNVQKNWHIGIGATVGVSGLLTEPTFVHKPTYSIGLSIVYTPFNFCNF